jgi:hypothetical protein
VAERRFPNSGAQARRSDAGRGLVAGLDLLALVALVVSMPLWLVPPLILILPPLIWGWLTYRVMAYDALAEHASRDERIEIFRRHRGWLLGIGRADRLSWARRPACCGRRRAVCRGLCGAGAARRLGLHTGVCFFFALVRPLLPGGPAGLRAEAVPPPPAGRHHGDAKP